MYARALSSDGGGSVTAPGTDAVAVVTGGSHGIGREVVRMLERRGYSIVVVYLDDQTSAEATVEEVLASGGTAVAVRADITDDLDVERLFDESIAVFGRVDALVLTTTHSASALHMHAACHLGRGAAIVSVSTAEAIAPAVARRLDERGITVNGARPGSKAPCADHDVADLISLLDRWRNRGPG